MVAVVVIIVLTVGYNLAKNSEESTPVEQIVPDAEESNGLTYNLVTESVKQLDEDTREVRIGLTVYDCTGGVEYTVTSSDFYTTGKIDTEKSKLGKVLKGGYTVMTLIVTGNPDEIVFKANTHIDISKPDSTTTGTAVGVVSEEITETSTESESLIVYDSAKDKGAIKSYDSERSLEFSVSDCSMASIDNISEYIADFTPDKNKQYYMITFTFQVDKYDNGLYSQMLDKDITVYNKDGNTDNVEILTGNKNGYYYGLAENIPVECNILVATKDTEPSFIKIINKIIKL
jgi:hypothetical protein